MSAQALKVPTIFTAVDKFTGPVLAMQKQLKAFTSASPTTKVFQNISNGADAAFDKIVNLKNAVVVGMGVAAVKSIYDNVRGMADLAEETLKTSKVLGINTAAFQELAYAAEIEGLTTEQLTNGLEKLNKNMADLKGGTGTLHAALAKSNPALSRQLKLATNNEEAFALLTDAINSTPDAFTRAKLAQAAFGKGGHDLIKLIEIGAPGIAALREEARRLGLVVSNETLEQLDKFGDSQQVLDKTLNALKMTLGAQLIPVIQKVTDKIMVWVTNNRELISAKVTEWADKISIALEWVVENIDAIIFALKIFGGLLIALKVVSFIASLISMASTIWTAVGAVWALVAANTALFFPLFALIAIVGAIIYLTYKLIKHWNEWGAAITLVIGIVGAFFNPFVAGFALVISLVQSFRRNWDMITEAFTKGGILAGLKAIGVTIIDAILMPLQQLLEIAAKVTGFDWASDAAKSIEKFRANVGVNVTTDESGNPIRALNPEAARQESLKENVKTSNSNKNVTVDFKNLPQGTTVTGDTGFNMLMPPLSSTMKISG